MADLDLQSLGMRLGEAITPTPRDAPQVRYGTIDAVNADGTLDVTIDGTTLRGMCATTGCVGAQAGMRCVVLRQGALATVVGLIANDVLSEVITTDGGFQGKWLLINGGTASITSYGTGTFSNLVVTGGISSYIGDFWTGAWTASSSSGNNQQMTAKTPPLAAGTYIVEVQVPVVNTSGFVCAIAGATEGNRYIKGENYAHAAFVLQVAEGAQLYVVSATTSSFTFGYLDRGWIRATRLK